MTDKFIPPPPSDEATDAAQATVSWLLPSRLVPALAAANAIDQPRVCRAEVEAFAQFVAGRFVSGIDQMAVGKAFAEFVDDRYGPAPVPVAPPGVAEVVALHDWPKASPHLCDRPETRAFLRAMAARFSQDRDARAFLAATDKEAK